MKLPALTLLAWNALFAGSSTTGLQVRSSPQDYAATAEDKGIRLAAEVLDRDQVRNLFSTDLSNYLVVEVAIWPRNSAQMDVSAIDFSLRVDGSRAPIRPAGARTIAKINQRRSLSKRDDIVLYPSVGVSTGTWGTGTNVGVGIGTGGNAPGPASTDRDRQTMEQELEDQGLPDVVTGKPVAGYLFFPVAGKRKKTGSLTYELQYEPEGALLRLNLPAGNP